MFPTSIVSFSAKLFSQPVMVDDYSSTLIDGVYVNNLVENRVIQAVIQPFTELDIAIETDGAQSDGYLLMHTAAPVFAFDNTSSSESSMQSFVRYKGNLWKVNKREDWADKTNGYNRYLLTKFVDPNSGIS